MLKIRTVLTNALFCAFALLLTVQSAWAVCPAGTASITHSTNVNDSWCELCSTAATPSTVRLIVNNEDPDNDLTNLVIAETLPVGMTYLAGSATVVGVLDGTAPAISSENITGSTITWTLSETLDSRRNSTLANWMYIDSQARKTFDSTQIALEDPTFRADVVGKITLSDETLLWFPAPNTSLYLGGKTWA